MTTTPTLELRNLEVAYTVRGIDRQVLRGVSFSIAPGEAYGLVGESGCGKSTAAFAAMRYLPRNGKITNGSIFFEGKDIVDINSDEVASELMRINSGPKKLLRAKIVTAFEKKNYKFLVHLCPHKRTVE